MILDLNPFYIVNVNPKDSVIQCSVHKVTIE